jgi:hypothetical protein
MTWLWNHLLASAFCRLLALTAAIWLSCEADSEMKMSLPVEEMEKKQDWAEKEIELKCCLHKSFCGFQVEVLSLSELF